MPHVWRFPWVMRRQIREAGFAIESFEAGPLVLPYLGEYVPAMRRLQPAVDRGRSLPWLRNLGAIGSLQDYGCLAVCRKMD